MSKLKLWHGGCGTVKGYVVADRKAKAVQKLSQELGIPYLPVEVTEVVVEGYDITVMAKGEKKPDKEEPGADEIKDKPEEGGEIDEPDTKHSGEGEGEPGAEGTGKDTRGKSGAGEKPDK